MSEWPSVPISDISVRVTVGFVGSQAPHFTDGGVPLLRGQNVRPYVLDMSNLKYISPETHAKWKKSSLQAGDVVIVRVGYPGTAAVIPDGLGELNAASLVIVRPDPTQLDSHFLAYVLNSPWGKSAVSARFVGAAQQVLNTGSVADLQIALPPLAIQHAITAILRSLDQLIENNRRRVAVLERMLRATYREWFVNFRYPGREGVPLVHSPGGPVPEGWEVSTCGTELSFIGGGTPSKSQPSYWDGGDVAWYTPTDLTKTGWRYAAPSELSITEQGLARSSARLFPAGSVMMTSRATLGVLAIATTEATTNQGFIVIRPDERWSPGFIYEWLDSKADELAALGTGATFKEITKGAFKNFPFVVPARSVLDAYRAATEPLEQQVHVLERQIRNLSGLRDLVLPKLVAGQIDVSTLDLDVLIDGRVA